MRVARVALRVGQAHAGVHHDAGVAQAQEVIAQQAALARSALALLVAPAAALAVSDGGRRRVAGRRCGHART